MAVIQHNEAPHDNTTQDNTTRQHKPHTKGTRKSQCCPVSGYPSRAKEIQLPTKSGTMRTFLQIRKEMKVTESAPEPAVFTEAERKAQHIEHIWIKASIPVISQKNCGENQNALRQLQKLAKTL